MFQIVTQGNKPIVVIDHPDESKRSIRVPMVLYSNPRDVTPAVNFMEAYSNALSYEERVRLFGLFERVMMLDPANMFIGDGVFNREKAATDVLYGLVGEVALYIAASPMPKFAERYMAQGPIPRSTAAEVEDDGSQQYRRYLTYTASDYSALRIFLAYMYPITIFWCMYAGFYSNSINNLAYVLYQSLQDIEWLYEHPGNKRLILYIETRLRRNENNPAVKMNQIAMAVNKVMDSDTLVYDIVGQAIIGKLVPFDNLSFEGERHLVTLLYKEADNFTKPKSNRYGTEVKDRVPESGDESRKQDGPRGRSDTTAGDIIAGAVMFSSPSMCMNIVNALPPVGITIQDVEQYYAHAACMNRLKIQEVQVNIASWVLAPGLTPGILMYFDRITDVTPAIAIAALWLDKSGYREVANMLLGDIRPGVGGKFIQLNSQMEAELNSIYCAAIQAKSRTAQSVHIEYITRMARDAAKYIIVYPIDAVVRQPGQYQMTDSVQAEIFNLAIQLAK